MPAKPRESKHITNKEDIDYILSLTEEDLLKLSVVLEMFGSFNGKRRFRPYDTIDIPPGSYGPEGRKNKNTFTTTVGRYVYNKIFIEKDLFDLYHYINEPVTKKFFKKINTKLAHARLEEKIELDVIKRYLLKTQKMMPIVTPLFENESEAFFLIADKIRIKKKELLKKYKKEIDSGNEDIIPKIEKELIQYAKDELGDDGSLDVFDNGENADYGNNFKNMFVMKGLVKKSSGKGYNVITSDYTGGITKDEYVKFAESLAAGPYSRARKTATGGYWEKLFRVFEHIVLDKPGSDCGTKRTIEVELTDDMVSYVMYSYVVDGNKLVELTDDTLPKYKGKTVKLRFASLCESKGNKICNKCAGNKFYRLGIKNIGSTAPQIGSKIKNINMKSFHDSQVTFVEMDPMKAFFPFGHTNNSINEDVSDNGVKVQTIDEAMNDENNSVVLLEGGTSSMLDSIDTMGELTPIEDVVDTTCPDERYDPEDDDWYDPDW